MAKIEMKVSTGSRYGHFAKGDVLEVGKDIDEAGAARWVDRGIAGETDKDQPAEEPDLPEVEKPTEDQTVKEIKAYLDAQDIEYRSNDTKPELLAKV